MADQLNMGGLSLDHQQNGHQNGMGGGRSAYIPPHMRGMPPPNMDGPPLAMNGSVPNEDGGAWGGPTK